MIEKLKIKIEQASESYKLHNFKKALNQYQKCIDQCSKIESNEARSILHNLFSSKAGIETSLNMLDEGLKSVGNVLDTDPFHLACLTRRSQIYKKQKKFKKALEDLKTITIFSPDNIQIAAYKLEIEALLAKEKLTNNQSEEEEEDEEEDQEIMLRFCNLKAIDRKSGRISSNITKSLTSQRKSMVTISGDTTVFYESNQLEQQKRQSSIISKQNINSKLSQIEKQLEEDNKKEDPYKDSIAKIKVVDSTKNRTKSILKNKTTSIFISDNGKTNPESRKSSLLQKIKDIDGKVIKEQIDHSEVKFRKSLFGEQNLIEKIKPKARQSCLKRSSFVNTDEADKINKPLMRKSKFELLSKMNIDGNLIPKENTNLNKENQREQSFNSDNDIGSSYNIYGNNQQFNLSKEIRESFGIQSNHQIQKKATRAGKSILKRSSFANQVQKKMIDEIEKQETISKEKKNKKSVMFNKAI